MRRDLDNRRTILLPVALGLVASIVTGVGFAENIDPGNDESQHAYGENVGWLNAEPSGNGGPGVQVGDSELSGWMWGENVGWISLSCQNTQSCDSTAYGVTNDGNGTLGGYAWAESVGWIDFAPSTSGVLIDPATGEFSGFAWGENVGWLSFNCSNTSSCGSADYRVASAWVCDPSPPAPAGTLELGRPEKTAAGKTLHWGSVPGATGYDTVRGDLSDLLDNGGDFGPATKTCLDDNRTTHALVDPDLPASGEGFWYLVRGQNCGGNGTYDSGGPVQVGPRDSQVLTSGNDCP
jgi:hypothetical protein